MKKFLKFIGFIVACYALGYMVGATYLHHTHVCKEPKAEFYGSTVIDADHIERTWIYRDTVEYSRPKIKFTL